MSAAFTTFDPHFHLTPDNMQRTFRDLARPLIHSYIRSARCNHFNEATCQQRGFVRFLDVGEADALKFLQLPVVEEGDGEEAEVVGAEDISHLVPQYGGEVETIVDPVIYLYSGSTFVADLIDIRVAVIAAMSEQIKARDAEIKIREEQIKVTEIQLETTEEQVETTEEQIAGDGEVVIEAELEMKTEVEVKEEEEVTVTVERPSEWDIFLASLIPLHELNSRGVDQRLIAHQVSSSKPVGKKKGTRSKGKGGILSAALTPIQMRAGTKNIMAAVTLHFAAKTQICSARVNGTKWTGI